MALRFSLSTNAPPMEKIAAKRLVTLKMCKPKLCDLSKGLPPQKSLPALSFEKQSLGLGVILMSKSVINSSLPLQSYHTHFGKSPRQPMRVRVHGVNLYA